MKAFLIELLKDYNVPGYRTQNAWSKEAWTNIVNRMNQKFGLSLTLKQVKQKEQDLKKDFRSVKDRSPSIISSLFPFWLLMPKGEVVY